MNRQQVIQALLELDCIPSKVRIPFSRRNEDRWELIKSVIKDCDYYIVIIGGKYGSKGPAGISHTEKEYRYARKYGLPTIAFLFIDVEKIPSGNIESETQVCWKNLGNFVNM